MIQNLEFKNSDGYIKTTIDNQTIDIPLKKIKKIPTEIINIFNENAVPLYVDIPIKVEFYSSPYEADTDSEEDIDNEEDNNTETDIEDDIFISYDEYIESKQLSPIDKGTVTIQIFDQNNNIVYSNDIDFANHQLITKIPNELPLGMYNVVIKYHGNKYYLPSDLSYKFYIQKRKLQYKFDKGGYSGNPLEIIHIQAQLYDALNGRHIPNCYVNYIFNDTTYLVQSDDNGYINISIKIPTQEYSCEVDTVIYDVYFYIDNDTYWSDIITQNIVMNKLNTQINAQCIPSDENETEFYIKGDVTANNYTMLENVKHGDISLTFNDGQEYTTTLSSDGLFSFLLNTTRFYNLVSNDIEHESFNTIQNIQTKLTLETNNSYDIGKEFVVKANVNNITSTKTINEGLVCFNLQTKNTPSTIITQYVAEVDNNGEAYGYFYPSNKGSFKIVAEYKGMFEYTDSTISKNINIV